MIWFDLSKVIYYKYTTGCNNKSIKNTARPKDCEIGRRILDLTKWFSTQEYKTIYGMKLSKTHKID